MTATAQVTPLRKPTRAPRNPPPLPKHVADKARMDMREIEAAVGLCESTIRALMAKGQFPQPDFRMGTRCVRWSASLVTAWLESTSTASN
jgi:predicted DNA-binding transcriptional regulator AlpA